MTATNIGDWPFFGGGKKLTIITHHYENRSAKAASQFAYTTGMLLWENKLPSGFISPLNCEIHFRPPDLLSDPTRDSIIRLVYTAEMIHRIICIILRKITIKKRQSFLHDYSSAPLACTGIHERYEMADVLKVIRLMQLWTFLASSTGNSSA